MASFQTRVTFDNEGKVETAERSYERKVPLDGQVEYAVPVKYRLHEIIGLTAFEMQANHNKELDSYLRHWNENRINPITF